MFEIYHNKETKNYIKSQKNINALLIWKSLAFPNNVLNASLLNKTYSIETT